jgi:hypothetical protein
MRGWRGGAEGGPWRPRLLGLVAQAPHRGAHLANAEQMSTLALSDWRQRLGWDSKEMLKARRIAFHVTRAAKKFLLGTGNAAWVMGTTMLVMVMPLAFEIDREQQAADMGAPM